MTEWCKVCHLKGAVLFLVFIWPYIFVAEWVLLLSFLFGLYILWPWPSERNLLHLGWEYKWHVGHEGKYRFITTHWIPIFDHPWRWDLIEFNFHFHSILINFQLKSFIVTDKWRPPYFRRSFRASLDKKVKSRNVEKIYICTPVSNLQECFHNNLLDFRFLNELRKDNVRLISRPNKGGEKKRGLNNKLELLNKKQSSLSNMKMNLKVN